MKWMAVLLALPSAVLAGPQTPRQSAPPLTQFTARTELVTVDVSVFDQQGRPLDGLVSNDFTVLVDGEPRGIAALSYNNSKRVPTPIPGRGVDQSPVDAAREAAAADQTLPRPHASEFPTPVRIVDRRFVILVDREHIRAGEGQQVLAAAARFINSLPLSDRVALWTLPGRNDRVDFDESRASVVRRVQRAIGVYRPLGDPAGAGFWNLNLTDRRQRALGFLGGVRDLLLALLAVDGPKHVVIVSGGSWMDTTNLGLVREVAALAAMSRTQVHAMHVRPLPGAAARVAASDIPSECRDERMLSTGAAAYELSLLTGGFADLPGEGLIEGAAFDQLGRQLSAWYLLGFEPTATDRDGRPHRVEVHVANRPGATVRARRMFYVEPGAVVPEKTEAPPPALEWDRNAENRTILGLVPFTWIPEWLDTAQHFCRAPEQGAGVEGVCNWETARLRNMQLWLDFFSDNREKVGQPSTWAGPDALRAAALLHTTAFFCEAEKGDRRARLVQLELGRQLLALVDGSAHGERSLLRLWHLATAQWVSAYGNYVDALALLQGGIDRFPDDAQLQFIAGTLHETLASPVVTMYRYTVPERIERAQQVRVSLDEAAKAYRRALDLAPELVQARLHLGRVLDLRGKPNEAVVAFERVIDAGADVDTLWLAHMFLGRVHEQAGRLREAITAYRRALGLRPVQSATIALAHALDRTGKRDAAMAQLQLLATAADQSTGCADGCDPWLQYNLVDRQQVNASIRALVRQACGIPE